MTQEATVEAKQRDLHGKSPAVGVRVTKTIRESAIVSTQHFKVSISGNRLDEIESKDDVSAMEKAVRAMVRPKKDAFVIPEGAADKEIPKLVRAVLDEVELALPKEDAYRVGERPAKKFSDEETGFAAGEEA